MAQEYRRVAVDSVRPHPQNPRKGDVAAIGESIAEDGFYGALVVQASTGHILAGTHRWLAAREEELTELPAIFVDVDDETALRILLVDNRASDLAGWDAEQLAAVLESFDGDVAGTGFSLEAAMDAIAAGSRRRKEGLTDPDEAGELPAEPVSRFGDVWVLGRHRLVVGDATDPAAWVALMGGEQADLVFTDPPYGVAYVGKTEEALTIGNDRLTIEATGALLSAAFAEAVARCRIGAVWYVCGPSGPAMVPFLTSMSELGLWRQSLVWVKDVFVLGHSDYHQRHEMVFYGWKPGAAHLATPDRTQDTVWEFDRPRASRDHPTMKPVALIEKAVENSCRPAGIVVDCFAGSGSTLLAAERTGRSARCLELDPRYADVIVRRWAEFTGEEPERVGGDEDGRERSEEDTEPAAAAAR